MSLGSILQNLSEIRYLRSVLKSHGGNLVRGKYRLYDSLRAMALDDPRVTERADVYFKKSAIGSKTEKLIHKLNKMGYFTNRNKKSSEAYEAIYVANNYDAKREVKLFSFERGKILTVCTCREEMEKQLLQYNSFSKAYNMPAVTQSGVCPDSFEVSMIKVRPAPGELLALDHIASATVGAMKNGEELKKKSVRELISFSYGDGEMDRLLAELASQISESALNTELPLCVQHGDLSKDNLMYGESDGKVDFWWIDWEHAGERVFFYDYFFYIINSAMFFDTKAYGCYASGDADKALGSFFARFGVEFAPEKKRDYFLIFAIVFLKERVCDRGFIEAMRKYCDFINSNKF